MVKKVLFVCTGNTDRSPMAQAILEQLSEENEIDVDSAGVWASGNKPASDASKHALIRRFGEDLLEKHISKNVSEVTLEEYDIILVMEDVHKTEVTNMVPGHRNIKTLKEFAGGNGEVNDPHNCSDEVYNRTVKEIEELLGKSLLKIIS